MTSISFYEARTHLSELLDQVAKGKKVLSTRRGKPAALLVPPPKEAEKDVWKRLKETTPTPASTSAASSW